MTEPNWSLLPFEELTLIQLYSILALREAVFVVEQNCVYTDIDGLDQLSMHLIAYSEKEIVAYSRLIPPGELYTEASIGRVVTPLNFRGKGLGKILMQKSINACRNLWPDSEIRIMAQSYLLSFYAEFGFVAKGKEFLDAGLPHRYMVF